MKLKKLISVILLTAMFCMTILPVSAAIGENSYSLSEIRPLSANGPIAVKIAMADNGESASYDKITAYVNNAEVASGLRAGDAETEIIFPANTFLPGVNTVEYKATLNGELYKTVTKKITAYKEVNDAKTILGAEYDDLLSLSISSWEVKNTSLGMDVMQIVGDSNTNNAVSLEVDGANKYLKYAPTGDNPFLRMRWIKSDTYKSGIIKLSTDIFVPDEDTIKKTNIYCYTGSHQFDSSSFFKAGKWNKVHWIFNIDKKSYSMYVEGGSGTVAEWSVGVPAELSLTEKELRNEIYVNSGKYVYLDNMKLEYLSADYDLFNISAPEEAVNGALLSMRPYLAGKIETYIDGNKVATDTAEAEKEITKIISADAYGVGIKNIKVKATLENGMVYTKYAKVNLSTKVESGIGSASGEMIDFNDLNEDCTEQINAMFSANVSDYEGSITRIAGKSGKEGDYAALFDFGLRPGASSANDYDGGKITLLGTASQRNILKEKGGKFIIEFDMMRYESTPNMYLRLPFGLWGTASSQYLLNSGSSSLRDTTTAVDKNWHNLKLLYDIDNNEWKVWVDEAEVTLTTATESSFAGDAVQFRFGRRDNGYQNKLALDNIRVYHIEEGAKVVEPSADSLAVIEGEQNINVKLDKAYEAEGKVYCEGAEAEGFTVSTTDKITYTVSGNFKANCEYKIAIGNVSVPLYVTDKNGLYIKVEEGKVADGKFTFDVESFITKALEDEIKLITATYNGDRVTSVNIDDIATNTTISYVRNVVPYTGTVTKAKAMFWNNMVPLIEVPDFVPQQ